MGAYSRDNPDKRNIDIVVEHRKGIRLFEIVWETDCDRWGITKYMSCSRCRVRVLENNGF